MHLNVRVDFDRYHTKRQPRACRQTIVYAGYAFFNIELIDIFHVLFWLHGLNGCFCVSCCLLVKNLFFDRFYRYSIAVEVVCCWFQQASKQSNEHFIHFWLVPEADIFSFQCLTFNRNQMHNSIRKCASESATRQLYRCVRIHNTHIHKRIEYLCVPHCVPHWNQLFWLRQAVRYDISRYTRDRTQNYDWIESAFSSSSSSDNSNTQTCTQNIRKPCKNESTNVHHGYQYYTAQWCR